MFLGKQMGWKFALLYRHFFVVFPQLRRVAQRALFIDLFLA
jgi:hypothetical protein